MSTDDTISGAADSEPAAHGPDTAGSTAAHDAQAPAERNAHAADDADQTPGPTRRRFIGGAATAGVAAVGLMFRDGFENPFTEPEQHGTGDLVDTYTASDVIHSMCMQCNTFCTIKVRLVDGGDTGATALVRKIAGNPYSPLTTQPVGPIPYDTPLETAVKGTGKMSVGSRSRSGGIACLKGQAGPQIVHDRKRITQPMKRVGDRGSGKWQTISWDDALKIILDGDDDLGTPGLKSWYKYAPKAAVMADWSAVQAGTKTQSEFEQAWGDSLIDATRPELGPKSNLLTILGGDRMAMLGQRWAVQSFGTINQFNHGGTCGVTGVVANARIHPTTGFQRMYIDIDYCRYLVVWGSEPLTAQKGPTWLAPRIGRARELGMKMAVIDPRMSKTGEKADVWIPVKPGRDAELAWGMIRYIIENKRYDEQYLRAPGKAAAATIGEPTWSDATHLVKFEDPKKGMLSMVDMGQAQPPQPAPDGTTPEAERVCLVGGQPTGADQATSLADLDVDTTIDTPQGPVRVKSVFRLLSDRAMERTIAEYAEDAGVSEEQVTTVARDLTSHGKQAGIISYRGAAMHANGFDAIRAIGYLNFLIGNHDWKGGHIGGQQEYSPDTGRYDLVKVPNARKAWGIPVTREKSKYEDTTYFKEDGYPAKRRWYQFPGNLCHEVLPSVEAEYPYTLNALFIHRHSPLNSSPGAHRQAKTLKDTDKIKLLVCFDVVVGDTSAYADLLLPDNTYLERFTQESIYPSQQYAVTQLGQPTTRAFKGPRPVEVTYLELGKALGLPGVGQDAFGPGAHWNTNEDYWLKMAANVAFAEDPVPDADEEELKIFTETREKYLKDAYDEEVWKAAVTAEEWAKVVYVLNRGGRFEAHGEERANGYDGEHLKYKYGGLCAFYDPKVAAAKDPITGKPFDGLAAIREPMMADGTPVPRDGFPLQFINWKARQQGTHRTVSSPWLRELRPANFVSMNNVDASKRGIKTGDSVTLTSPAGKVTGIALLTEAIRPGIVGADATFGFDQYGSKQVVIDGKAVKPPKRYGHEESARKITPQHEETGYAGPRDAGFAVNELLVDETLVGGGGMTDPVGGGAAQLDTWVEVTKA